ncbi:hypothetical protein PC115_g18579 [Phytophthora cactorum]|uniref:Uncharacterized protein n=1 Tax=Phytophthora cactorum TaxID=29920 RepID=A0A8T1B1E3_9STRA|nr:hypothetical protein PC115_g18579 [Phytophthora cactorum]
MRTSRGNRRKQRPTGFDPTTTEPGVAVRPQTAKQATSSEENTSTAIRTADVATPVSPTTVPAVMTASGGAAAPRTPALDITAARQTAAAVHYTNLRSMARVDNGEAAEWLTTAVLSSEARGAAGNDQPARDKNAKGDSQSAGDSKLTHDNSNALVTKWTAVMTCPARTARQLHRQLQ